MDTKTLEFKKTIKSWDEAIPLGNGDLGCLIWNRARRLRFSIDKAGIWDCSNPPKEQADFNYKNLMSLVREGRQKEIADKYDDCYHKPTPTKLPAGKIILDLGVYSSVSSKLDFGSALATLQAGKVKVRSFVRATGDYGLIEADKVGIRVKIDNPKFGKLQEGFENKSKKGTVQSLKNLRYPEAKFFSKQVGDCAVQYFIQQTNDCYYGIVLASKTQNGKTLIAYTVGLSKQNDFSKASIEKVLKALKLGFDKALETHLNWWKNYWDKSALSLPDKLIEKNWNLNAYLLASCSKKGKLPMPLQGVWTADNGCLPPWKGDYHHDLNTQMSYTSYLKANRLEQGECFIDFLLDKAQAGRSFAKEFYGVDGLCLPSVMDVEGNALGGWCQYAMSPTNQLWLCSIMARHFYYTQDKDYLIKIYPYCLEVGEFILNMLKEVGGKYKLELSTSPEIHDNSLSAWLEPNSNYDLALMRAFCLDMIKLSKALNKLDEVSIWQNHLNKFDSIAIDKENVLMLSPAESPYESHRHHSHCMAIYPLRTMKYDNEKDKIVIDATIKNLEKFGIRNWVGYSFGWMAQLYAIQRNGDKSLEMLTQFFKYFCTNNGFHSNGDYRFKTACAMRCRLFTLEANFLAMDAVEEMLLYSEEDKTVFLPAVPTDWKELSFDKLRGFGGVLYSLKAQNGVITYLRIEAEKDVEICIGNDKKDFSFEIENKLFLSEKQVLEFGRI